ncbi:hypothetical protein ABSL23_16180 (plasmid) [Halobacterium sp. NMX12-1]|uniref:NrS-1 polymerase-like HBD domain-containing protein n=1 Tax=Halobacterium sp. NMX12-1 TaxID=3166650 RepID=A0AAU8CHV3_9EURY
MLAIQREVVPMLRERIPHWETVPEALRKREQWVCWRAADSSDTVDGIWVTPIDPATGERATFDDETTWSGFEDAYATATASDLDVDGLAFYPTRNDPFTAVELTACRDPETGDLDDWAQTVIETLDSYTEVTSDGQSIRILVAGRPPSWTFGAIDICDAEFYIPITGEWLSSTPATITERTTKLRGVYKAWKGAADPSEAAATLSAIDIQEFGGLPSEPGVDVDLSDTTVIERAQYGPAGNVFRRLWSGSSAGYASQREADVAFCSQLAYWTGGDSEQIERLVRQSDRNRAEWVSLVSEDTLYDEWIIERALALSDDYYDPRDAL